jgi:CRP/FNR family transcriptional regulator
MLNSVKATRSVSFNRQIRLVHEIGLNPNRATGALYIADRYRSADRQIKAGSDLFSQGERGEAIYSLTDGWVALYKLLEDGRRQILQFSLPGAVLAFMPSRSAVMNYSAQALTNAIVQVVPYDNLARLSRDNPEIGMQLAGMISRDRSLAYEHLSSIGRTSARERVASLLLELFIRSRLHWPGHRSEEMNLPVTQEHIGDATGLTGVHVNRVVRDLCKDRILEFHYRRLCILNPDKLVDVAGIDPHVALSWIDNDTSNGENAGKHNTGVAPASMRVNSVRRTALHMAPQSAPEPWRPAALGVQW